MSRRRISGLVFLMTQVVFVSVFAVAYGRSTRGERELLLEASGVEVPVAKLEVPRTTALVIEPLYDAPDVVSHEDLAAVLWKVVPRFSGEKLKPNYVEHALRTWSIRATFNDPAAMSGEAMKDYLVDHGKYLASWGDAVDPLLVDEPDGVAIRWGKLEGASVHHDHWLACLTEAGVSIDEPVFTPNGRDRTIRDVLLRTMRDFRVDEVETEWTSLALGLWLPPERNWFNSEGREISFDLLAFRLMRGERSLGVCSGTHRVYSLMALVRLDDEFRILSPAMRADAWSYLEGVRDAITLSQFPDGHWPSNWPEGAAAVEHPKADELYKQVIATGHHLEWLAIAPPELHPPREQIQKAARWIIRTTKEMSVEDILQRYTFFSHVGNALALWRHTHPPDFWKSWEAAHPDYAPEEPVSALKAVSATATTEAGH